MRIGMLGTGMVGTGLADRFVELGHDVVMGARRSGNERAAAWAAGHPQRAANGTFADAAVHGDVVVNATAGAHSLDALNAAGAEHLAGKVLLDVANPIAGYGPPIRLDPAGDESLGERIQRTFPDARVVKGLNTVNVGVMVRPDQLAEPTDVFLAGDDDVAKGAVRALLTEMGWQAERVRDLGGISAARGLEMYLVLWQGIALSLGRFDLNVRVVTP